MSRERVETPMGWPEASLMSDIVTDTNRWCPSFSCLSTSKVSSFADISDCLMLLIVSATPLAVLEAVKYVRNCEGMDKK
jgi:hypothetical protein